MDLPRRRLPSRIPPGTARERLTRERPTIRVVRALGLLVLNGLGRPRRPMRRVYETVHLPCCWIEIEPEPAAPVAVLVDGFARTAQMVHREALETSEPHADLPEFAYPLSTEATLELARQAILNARLNRQLHGTGVPTAPSALRPTALLSYPYEVLHFPRGRRHDFRMLDLVTGRPGGPLLRLAYVQALRQAARNETAWP